MDDESRAFCALRICYGILFGLYLIECAGHAGHAAIWWSTTVVLIHPVLAAVDWWFDGRFFQTACWLGRVHCGVFWPPFENRVDQEW